jgi:hypothetical protein
MIDNIFGKKKFQLSRDVQVGSRVRIRNSDRRIRESESVQNIYGSGPLDNSVR